MLYLDANVFIYAALNLGDLGDKARSLLREIQQGKLRAASSVLTFDEFIWAVQRYRSVDHAITAGEAFLNMPGLKLVNADGDLLSLALELIRRYKLAPRDSIHAASAISENTETIISTDEDFDRVKEISRRTV